MPVQLKTLIPLFAILIIIFLVARYFLVPESFGEKGHYRFNSVEENKQKALNYAGKQTCLECHEDKAMELESDMHSGISCETCHGPGLKHSENPDSSKMIVPAERAFCGLCHAFNPTREGILTQIDINEHNVKYKCIECHNPHAPWENL